MKIDSPNVVRQGELIYLETRRLWQTANGKRQTGLISTRLTETAELTVGQHQSASETVQKRSLLGGCSPPRRRGNPPSPSPSTAVRGSRHPTEAAARRGRPLTEERHCQLTRGGSPPTPMSLELAAAPICTPGYLTTLRRKQHC